MFEIFSLHLFHAGLLPSFETLFDRFEFLSDRTWGPFPEGIERFSHPESHSKISKLIITELFIRVFLI